MAQSIYMPKTATSQLTTWLTVTQALTYQQGLGIGLDQVYVLKCISQALSLRAFVLFILLI